jgi:hypothetical protein
MRKFACILIFLFSLSAFAQVQSISTSIKKKRTVEKKKIELKRTTLGFGAGMTRSVVFLSRNVREFNDASGINVCMVYGGNRIARFGFDYHQYNALDIVPTWYNIHARTYEANVQFLARFRDDKALIYPLVGLSYNDFRGYFTGLEDFQNLRDKYPVNSEVHSYWIGVNFGMGYEHKIGPIKAYFSYKMRIGAQDVTSKLNIMDVCYSLGLRYDIKALTPKYVVKTIMRTYRPRYDIDK